MTTLGSCQLSGTASRRAPSDSNSTDSPSRGECQELQARQAHWVEPRIPKDIMKKEQQTIIGDLVHKGAAEEKFGKIESTVRRTVSHTRPWTPSLRLFTSAVSANVRQI